MPFDYAYAPSLVPPDVQDYVLRQQGITPDPTPPPPEPVPAPAPAAPSPLDVAALVKAQAADAARARREDLGNDFHYAAALMAGEHPDAPKSYLIGQGVRDYLTRQAAAKAQGEQDFATKTRQWAEEDRPDVVAQRQATTQRTQAQTEEDVAKAKKETADLADVELQRKALNDPASIESQTVRDIARRYKMQVDDSVSGAVILRVLPSLEKSYEAQIRAKYAGLRITNGRWSQVPDGRGGFIAQNSFTLERRRINPDGSLGVQLSPPRRPDPLDDSDMGGGDFAPSTPPASGEPSPVPTPKPRRTASTPKPATPAPGQPGILDRLPDPGPDGAPQFVHDPKNPPYQNKEIRIRQEALGKDIDPNQGTGEVANNMKRVNAAIRLRKLVQNDDGTVKDNIPPQFMKEVAMALAQMINNGGQPAEGLINELTARTKSSKWADWMQYLTDKPQDAGQQGFVKLYLESANREAKVAQTAIDKALQGRVGKHADFIRSNPEDAWKTASTQGYDLDPKTLKMVPVYSDPTPETAGWTPRGVASAGGGEVKQVKSKAERDALPAGTKYTRPGDPTVYTKS